MQAQAHVSGQVSSEAAGQLRGLAQQNGGSLPSQASNIVALRKSWHSDSDWDTVRNFILQRILQLLQRLTPEWQHQLSDLSRMVYIERLFLSAPLKI